MRSQIATSNDGRARRGGRRYAPRAFVHLREALAMQGDLAKKLEELEGKTEAPAPKHDRLAAGTRAQFREVIDALRALMNPPEPRKRPIGFVTHRDE